MKQIKTLLALLCIVLTAASCSKESTEEAPNTPTDVAQLIKIAPFPAFDEGTQTRAIGTEDPGKTTWENGDEVLLGIQFVDNEGKNVGVLQDITLTYDNEAWKADKSLDFTLSDYRANTATITAYYAPAYEWSISTGELVLKSDKNAGTDERLVYTANNVEIAKGITIDFAKATRTYSRLRIATIPELKISVELSTFTPANGTGEGKSTTFTLTTDAKGNAYLYGKWGTDITVSTTDAPPVKLAKITGLSALKSGQSYVLAAYPQAANYNDRGNGDENDPYLIWNAAQLQNMNTAKADSKSKIFVDKHFKLINDIDCSGITEFTPIGNKEKKFAGIFDGDGHTISNLTLGVAVSTSNVVYSGLFAYAEGATISNLTLLNPKLSADAKQKAELIGALIGLVSANFASETTTITNCHVCLSAGSNATIESTSTSESSVFVGGLIGQCSYTSLQACSSAIPVISKEKNSGGLIGSGGNITLIGCRTTGAVTGQFAGGLAGAVTVSGITIVGCYTSSTLSGTLKAGGFVGDNYNVTVLSSYCASSEISAPSIKGSFLGYNGKISYLYYSAATSNLGTNGVGSGSFTEYLGGQLGCAPGELYDAIVNPEAEAKWQELTFEKIRIAIGNKPLSDIWVNVSDAAPRLWWEK